MRAFRFREALLSCCFADTTCCIMRVMSDSYKKKAHAQAVSKWRARFTKTKSIVFDMRKPLDKAVYEHLAGQANATAYIKELVAQDIAAQEINKIH